VDIEQSKHGAVTPTELLMSVLEDFGTYEPKSALVIFTDINGALQLSSCQLEKATIIGLLEWAKQMILHSR
jgi:hypothetical protein